MRRSRNGYTMRQYAYAKNIMGAKGDTKKQIALSVGYSKSVAERPGQKIESTDGFNNAMIQLAGETGNVVLQVFHALKKRDMEKEDTETLLNAVDKLSKAFERFAPVKKKDEQPRENPLRAIIRDIEPEPKQ